MLSTFRIEIYFLSFQIFFYYYPLFWPFFLDGTTQSLKIIPSRERQSFLSFGSLLWVVAFSFEITSKNSIKIDLPAAFLRIWWMKHPQSAVTTVRVQGKQGQWKLMNGIRPPKMLSKIELSLANLEPFPRVVTLWNASFSDVSVR